MRYERIAKIVFRGIFQSYKMQPHWSGSLLPVNWVVHQVFSNRNNPSGLAVCAKWLFLAHTGTYYSYSTGLWRLFFLFDQIPILWFDSVYIILSKIFSFHVNLLLWMPCFYSINHGYLKKPDKGVVLEGWISISLHPNMKAAQGYSL